MLGGGSFMWEAQIKRRVNVNEYLSGKLWSTPNLVKLDVSKSDRDIPALQVHGADSNVFYRDGV